MNAERLEFHLPVRPYSPIDALNRKAAALGSPRYAAATAYADYNGHHVTLSWNSYRGYYVAEYFWAGRVVVARGDFANCLAAVLAEYARGALGASATVVPREDDAEAIALCERTAELSRGSIWRKDENGRSLSRPWWTWQHECANAAARDSANPGALVMHFDWVTAFTPEPGETTSLSGLSESEWSQLSCQWARGVSWYVSKVGRKWAVSEAFGKFPLFKTKRAAHDAATNLFLWEARCRSARRDA